MQGGSRRKSAEIAGDRPETPRDFEGTAATLSRVKWRSAWERSVRQDVGPKRIAPLENADVAIGSWPREPPSPAEFLVSSSAVYVQGRRALLDPLADHRDDAGRKRICEEFAERHLRPVARGRRGQLLVKVAAGRIAWSDQDTAAGIRRRSGLPDEILPSLTSQEVQRSPVAVTGDAVVIEDLLDLSERDGIGTSIGPGADGGARIGRRSAIGARVNRAGRVRAAIREEQQKKNRARSARHRG